MLKYCVINNDKTKLKELLLETISIRRQLFKKNNDAFKEFWKFYFLDTDLVFECFKFSTNEFFQLIFHSLKILYDFHIMFENIDDKSLEKKWDVLHDKPLSDFKDQIDMDKIPTVNIRVWQLVTTIMTLKPRGNIWNGLSSVITFSEVRKLKIYYNF